MAKLPPATKAARDKWKARKRGQVSGLASLIPGARAWGMMNRDSRRLITKHAKALFLGKKGRTTRLRRAVHDTMHGYVTPGNVYRMLMNPSGAIHQGVRTLLRGGTPARWRPPTQRRGVRRWQGIL